MSNTFLTNTNLKEYKKKQQKILKIINKESFTENFKE